MQHLASADARALRALRSKADVFLSERFREHGGSQMTRDAFAKLLATVAARAGIDRRLLPSSCCAPCCCWPCFG
jgi:hypothetical protein